MVGCTLLILSINDFDLFSPCSHKKNMSSIYRHHKYGLYSDSNYILFRLCVWLCQSTELHIMNEEKILQRLYNLLEDAFRTFYHIVFLEVSKSYGVIPNGLKIKRDACIGNVSIKFVTSWRLELCKAEIQLMEVLILEDVRKLSQ